jgi:N6-adenosine-specific RNA methylase IME4
MRGKKSPALTLKDQNIDKDLAKAARKAAAESEDKFESRVTKTKQVAKAVADGNDAVVKAARAERQAEKKKRRAKREAELASKIVALPDKRYGIILADPEWQFEPWSRKTGMDRAAANHYPTSCTEVIAARDVPSIAAKDCALFLCATAPMLPHALLVMAAWGFDYVTNVSLHKDRVITGYWFRNKHEHLLLGTRGKVPCPAAGEQWESVIEMMVGRHSAKPDAIYQMIEDYFPNIPKIELNARKARKGWDCWGAEAPINKEAAE